MVNNPILLDEKRSFSILEDIVAEKTDATKAKLAFVNEQLAELWMIAKKGDAEEVKQQAVHVANGYSDVIDILSDGAHPDFVMRGKLIEDLKKIPMHFNADIDDALVRHALTIGDTNPESRSKRLGALSKAIREESKQLWDYNILFDNQKESGIDLVQHYENALNNMLAQLSSKDLGLMHSLSLATAYREVVDEENRKDMEKQPLLDTQTLVTHIIDKAREIYEESKKPFIATPASDVDWGGWDDDSPASPSTAMPSRLKPVKPSDTWVGEPRKGFGPDL